MRKVIEILFRGEKNCKENGMTVKDLLRREKKRRKKYLMSREIMRMLLIKF